MENFKCNFLDILEDEEAISRLHLIFEPMFKTLLSPLSSKMQETINILSETVAQLKKENEAKDAQIRDLKNEVKVMTNRIDDLEQHGRRDSMRIFGLSESTPGSTDEKVLRLCNTRMKLQPPLSLDEIAVSHRVGKLPDETSETTPAPPRALLVKFSTRRSKYRVMAEKKYAKLPSADDVTEEEYADMVADGARIYLADDLTKTRANLAFKAREAKRKGELMDTWVIDAKVMVKDLRARIRQIRCPDDLDNILRQWWTLYLYF